MDILKKIAAQIAGAAPLIGTILAGPGGAAVGTAVKLIASVLGVEPTPESIESALANDPEALAKIKTIELNNQLELQKLVINLEIVKIQEETKLAQEDTKRIEGVNLTMRTEAVSGGWPAFWRPYWGVVSGTAFGVVSVFVCYLAYEAIIAKDMSAMTMIPQIISSFTMLFGVPGAILGIAAWHRGKMQRESVMPLPAITQPTH
jgi:hypothetical protein